MSNVMDLAVVSETPVDGRFVLTGDGTLQSADAIHSKLLEMAAQPVVEIDCSGATEVDLSLVQLILAARRSAERSGCSVKLAQPAAGALLDTLRRGGFLGTDADEPRPDQAFWLQAGAK